MFKTQNFPVWTLGKPQKKFLFFSGPATKAFTPLPLSAGPLKKNFNFFAASLKWPKVLKLLFISQDDAMLTFQDIAVRQEMFRGRDRIVMFTTLHINTTMLS